MTPREIAVRILNLEHIFKENNECSEGETPTLHFVSKELLPSLGELSELGPDLARAYIKILERCEKLERVAEAVRKAREPIVFGRDAVDDYEARERVRERELAVQTALAVLD